MQNNKKKKRTIIEVNVKAPGAIIKTKHSEKLTKTTTKKLNGKKMRMISNEKKEAAAAATTME